MSTERGLGLPSSFRFGNYIRKFLTIITLKVKLRNLKIQEPKKEKGIFGFGFFSLWPFSCD
jgi:hypothetical protein